MRPERDATENLPASAEETIFFVPPLQVPNRSGTRRLHAWGSRCVCRYVNRTFELDRTKLKLLIFKQRYSCIVKLIGFLAMRS